MPKTYSDGTSQHMKLTVVIVNYKVEHFLVQCLHSVSRSMQGIDGEVIVVDNASGDGSIDYVRRMFPDFTYIENSENVGFARANNIGIRRGTGEYVMLLNPDTFIDEQLIPDCIHLLDSDPSIGATGVRMLNQDGTFALESRRGVPTPFTAFCKMTGLNSLFPHSHTFGRYYMRYLDEHEANPVEVISGACMFIRRSVLDKCGLLDENFFMYGEDIDLSYRMLQTGHRNYYLPTLMLHYKGESSNKNTYHYVYIFYQAMYIFFRKHYSHYNWLLSVPIRMAIYLKGASEYLSRKLWQLVGSKQTMLEYMQQKRYLLRGSNRNLEKMVDLCERHGLVYDQGSASYPAADYVVFDTDSFSYHDILCEMEQWGTDGNKRPMIATYSSQMNCIITGLYIFE